MAYYILSAAVGLLVGWLIAAARMGGARAAATELRAQSERLREELDAVRAQLQETHAARIKSETELAESARAVQEQRKLLDEARTKLADSFKALSADALKSNNEAFLDLAKKALEAPLEGTKGELGKHREALAGLLKPLGEALKRYEVQVQAIENSRQKAYGSLEKHLETLATTHQRLMKETDELVAALRRPDVRGRWGEVSLRRVVELAGMSEHCDYDEQASVTTEEGRLRPDMVVHMPGGRDVVVDAKVSLAAYLEAVEAPTEEQREACLVRHAQQIREHVRRLAAKTYWEQFERSPDFVIMFIPGESFLAVAAGHDRGLVEFAMERKVVLATPVTLIALLRAVEYGWRQEDVAKNAREVSELGRLLYERLRTMGEHFDHLRRGLETANESYNKAVRSLESRVFPAARKFPELGVAARGEIAVLQPVERAPRVVNADDLTESGGETS